MFLTGAGGWQAEAKVVVSNLKRKSNANRYLRAIGIMHTRGGQAKAKVVALNLKRKSKTRIGTYKPSIDIIHTTRDVR